MLLVENLGSTRFRRPNVRTVRPGTPRPLVLACAGYGVWDCSRCAALLVVPLTKWWAPISSQIRRETFRFRDRFVLRTSELASSLAEANHCASASI
jgi:hypothetical protein